MGFQAAREPRSGFVERRENERSSHSISHRCATGRQSSVAVLSSRGQHASGRATIAAGGCAFGVSELAEAICGGRCDLRSLQAWRQSRALWHSLCLGGHVSGLAHFQRATRAKEHQSTYTLPSSRFLHHGLRPAQCPSRSCSISGTYSRISPRPPASAARRPSAAAGLSPPDSPF